MLMRPSLHRRLPKDLGEGCPVLHLHVPCAKDQAAAVLKSVAIFCGTASRSYERDPHIVSVQCAGSQAALKTLVCKCRG